MGLAEFLNNKVENVQKLGLYQKLFSESPKLMTQQQLEKGFKPIQLDNNGGLIQNPDIMTKEQYDENKLSLSDRIFGKYKTELQDVINDDGTKSVGLSSSKIQNGFLDDLQDGFKENASNSFDVQNLAPNENKNIANRIGEGLGTTLRFANSPTGRMALTGGIVLASGGNGLEAIAHGARTGAINQKIRTTDQAYRDMLDGQGLDTNKINGWIDGDTAKTYALNNYRANSLAVRQDLARLSNNTQRAKMISSMLNNRTISPEEAMLRMSEYGIKVNDLSVSNATRNTDINEFLAPHKANAYDSGAMATLMNASGNQALLPYREASMQADIQSKKIPQNVRKTIIDNNVNIEEIDGAIQELTQNPKAFGYLQGILPKEILNRADPSGIDVRTRVGKISAEYMKYLSGAAVSEAEFKRNAVFLPQPNDNPQIVVKKLENMKRVLQSTNQQYQAQTGLSNTHATVVQKLQQAGYTDGQIQEYLKTKGL